MKTVRELYTKWRIMPSLQLHQLRVAAVVKLIADNFTEPVNKEEVILACLFHDMGNIIKSDLTYFPEFTKPEGVEHWEKIKSEFIQKYGTNHHKANIMIAKDIGLPSKSVTLIDSIGFSQIAYVVEDQSNERKIMQYADIRVGPHGVLSLNERLAEGRKRYNATRKARTYYESDDEFMRLERAAEELEKQIATLSRIAPEDITDAAVAPLIEELRNYPVA